jgi:hypothetical protein
MEPFEIDDIQQTALYNINVEISDAIDEYNAAVAAGNDELAQMIHLSIQGMYRRKTFILKQPLQKP